MKLKRNVFVVVACLLVLTLGIAMICGGCKKDNKPDWNYTGTINQTQSPNPTDPDGTTPDGTGPNGTTPDGTTQPTGPVYTPVGPGVQAPSVDMGVVDREELPSSTTPSGGTESTKPPVVTVPPTQPSVPDTDGPQLDADGNWTYEYYMSRTGDEQEAYALSFPGGLKEFNKWFNAAQKAYFDAQPKETIGPGGVIDLN